MNKQEIEKAIETLKICKSDIETLIMCDEEIETAISTLEHQLTNGWIPVSERLPDKQGYYIVTTKSGSIHIAIYKAQQRSFYEENKLYKVDILAWKPMGEPYKEVSE